MIPHIPSLDLPLGLNKGKILETAYRRVSTKTAPGTPALYFYTILTLKKFLFQLEYLLQSLQKAKRRLQYLKALKSQVLLYLLLQIMQQHSSWRSCGRGGLDTSLAQRNGTELQRTQAELQAVIF